MAGAAAQQAAPPAQGNKTDQPSIIIVEVLGFGGGDGTPPASPQKQDERLKENHSEIREPGSRVQVLDVGELTPSRRKQLLEEKRRLVERQ